MANDMDLKGACLASLIVAVRASSAASKIDTERLLASLADPWSGVTKGGPLELDALYRQLMGMPGVTPNDAAQVCLLLKRHETALGVKMKLPDLVSNLPQNVKAELSGRSPAPGPARVPTAVPGRAPTGVSRPAPAPAKQQLSASTKVYAGPSKNSRVIMLVVALVVCGSAAAWFYSTLGPARANLALPDGIPQVKVFHDQEVYYFYDEQKNWDYPREELERIANLLFKTVEAAGGKNVNLCVKGPEHRTCSNLKLVRYGGGFYVPTPTP